MATIIRRGKKWQARVRRTGYPEQSQSFLSYAEARIWVHEVENGTEDAQSSTTRPRFADLIDRYRREITPLHKGADVENVRLRQLRRSPLAAMSPTAIQPRHIVEYRNARGRIVTLATVVREMTLLSQIFAAAISEWMIPGLTNPVKSVRRLPIGVSPPKARDRRILDVTFDGKTELDWLLEASSSRLQAVILLAVETAMRRSEIVAGFGVADVSLKHRTVTLRDTKNGDQREVPLSTAATLVLAELALAGRLFEIQPHSVTTAFRRARTRARKRFVEWCEEQGEPVHPRFLLDLRLHDLRHEATSRLIESGFNAVEASAITGHRDLRSLKRYTHLDARKLALRLK
jgi:integrase